MVVLKIEHAPTHDWLVTLKSDLSKKLHAESASIADRRVLGSLELLDGNVDEAHRIYPTNWPIHTDNLSGLLCGRGHIDEAAAYGQLLRSYFVRYMPDRLDQHGWRTINLARVHYLVEDYESAETLLREAREISLKIEKRDYVLHNWVTLELAILLHDCGRKEESQALSQECLQEMSNATLSGVKDIFGGDMDRVVQWRSQIGTGSLSNIDEIIFGLSKTRLTLDPRWRPKDAQGAMYNHLGALYEQCHAVTEAVATYKIAAWNRLLSMSALPVDGPEERLLELFASTDRLEEGCQFFADLLEHRKQQLPSKHPTIALTQIRLAKLLIKHGQDPSRTTELLAEARAEMSRHKATPQHVFDEIDKLTATIKTDHTLAVSAD